MIRGEDVVQEARRWIGTPYRHQASCLGYGADCLGLVRGVWRAFFGTEPELLPAYTMDWAEPSGEEVLLKAAERHMLPTPLNDHAPGDIVVFRMRANGIAKHVGIAAALNGMSTIIHSYSGHGVCETPLSTPWQRKVAGRFGFPKGAE